ncbi:PhoX family protein [Azohydromonas lata]|uniref:PhoX family protein n=1 Tax=Azohydromonas lata TaxID=45677 RepID=UPI00082BECD0|nr:alkaline phosphatase PhoX [Azohydromonas lata]
MHNSPTPSRRRMLQLLGGVPLLPLAAAGCASGRPGPDAAPAAPQGRGPVRSVRFEGMAAPTLADPAAMATTRVASALVATLADGSQRRHALQYDTFFITGALVPDGAGGQVVAGGCFDIHNRPITDPSNPGRRQFFSDAPDGMSLLQLPRANVPGVRGHTLFAVVQFEYTTRDAAGASMYGQLPSPIAVLTLDQDPATGRLRLVKYANVDTSAVHGLWTTCGASLSPWNTHLASEEYEPDAAFGDESLAAFSRHLYGDPARANPYHYGHLPEVTVLPDGTGRIAKHYCLGRISHELVQVMPDERTVLMGDDATNAGAFMFIADRPRDLCAGTLYVGRWHQTSASGPGAATLSWIRLGHASSAEIRALVDGGIRAADIMDVSKADPADASFTKIPFAGGFHWVRVKPGMEKAAAFLETHRFAALAGGSLGFTKWEGTTVNARDKVAYVAMSRIEASMLDGSGGVKVEGPYSGAVYAQNLRGGQRDHRGAPIASDWVPVDMAAVPALVAEDFGGGKLRRQDALGNFAHPDKLSMPDNLKFNEALRTLFIGEDSSTHVNSFLWAYEVDTGRLSRLLSCPAGAESTGLHAVDAVNGFTYVMSNFQHPGDWESPLHDKVRPVLDPLIRARYRDRNGAAVGYLTAAPAAHAPG